MGARSSLPFLLLLACGCDRGAAAVPVAPPPAGAAAEASTEAPRADEAPRPAASPSVAATAAVPDPDAGCRAVGSTEEISDGQLDAGEGVTVSRIALRYSHGSGKCAVELDHPEIAIARAPAVAKRINAALKAGFLADLPEECQPTRRRDARPARAGQLCADLPPDGASDVVGGYTVAVLRSGVLSVLQERMTCTSPAAHPSFRDRGYTFRLSDGAVLPLAELFVEGTDVGQLVSEWVSESDAPLDADRADQYVLRDRALVLLELGTGAAHSVQLEVPFCKLAAIARPASPLARLAGP